MTFFNLHRDPLAVKISASLIDISMVSLKIIQKSSTFFDKKYFCKQRFITPDVQEPKKCVVLNDLKVS